MPTTFTFTTTPDESALLIEALGKLPLERSYMLFVKLQRQAAEQQEIASAEEDPNDNETVGKKPRRQKAGRKKPAPRRVKGGAKAGSKSVA